MNIENHPKYYQWSPCECRHGFYDHHVERVRDKLEISKGYPNGAYCSKCGAAKCPFYVPEEKDRNKMLLSGGDIF